MLHPLPVVTERRPALPDHKCFYDKIYETQQYAHFQHDESHFAFQALTRFIADFRLRSARCLEVGSGRGYLQDIVEDYTGLDISTGVARYYRKAFFSGSAEALPFANDSFDAIWSITVLEHIADPQKALEEMRRVLRPGGLLYLHPAWHCRWWICEGIPVRAYEELTLRQKWVKLTLPIRDCLLIRASTELPKRIWKLFGFPFRSGPISLSFDSLPADHEIFWMVDSDACCSIDPLDVIQWFQSRHDEVVSHPTKLKTLLSRNEAVIVRIGKS